MICCVDHVDYIVKGILCFFNSALVSAIVGVILGSWIIQRLHNRYEFERSTIRWVIEKVDQYVGVAFKYWNSIAKEAPTDDQEILRAQLRSEFSFLVRSTEGLHCVEADKARMHDIVYSFMDLFNAATGDNFDAKEISVEEALEHLGKCAYASAKVRRALFQCMA